MPVDPPLTNLMEAMDPTGRLARDGVLRFQRWAEQGNPPPETPDALFGPWDELPPNAQEGIRRTLEEEILGGARWMPRRPLWTHPVHQVFTLAGMFRKREAPGLARSISYMGEKLWGGPRSLRRKLREAALRSATRAGEPRTLRELLFLLGREPHWLTVPYAKGVEVPQPCRGFYSDPEKNYTEGYLLGLDLIPNEGGIWCIEANLGAALREDRRRFFERDPVSLRVLEMVREKRVKRLVWIVPAHTPLNPWLMGQLAEGARVQGFQLEVREDPRVPTRLDLPHGAPEPLRTVFPPEPTPDTLVVKTRGWGVGSDLVVNHKSLFLRNLDWALEETGETRVRAPVMTRNPPAIPLQDNGLPNLVYKFPGMDKGRGVFFLRARGQEHARELARGLDREMGQKAGLFQPYLLSNLLPGRRFYDVRTLLFVSPDDVVPLGGLRKESAHPIPELQEDGVIRDRRPFSMSIYYGNDYAPLASEEVKELDDASRAVGEAIQRILSRGFITGPGQGS